MINPEITQATLIGYIRRPATSSTPYSFLTVIYEVEGKYFTAALDNKRRIMAFVLYTGEKHVVKIEPIIKKLGDYPFFVFRNGEEVIYGSILDPIFVQKIRNVMKNFSHEEYLLKEKLEKILLQKVA